MATLSPAPSVLKRASPGESSVWKPSFTSNAVNRARVMPEPMTAACQRFHPPHARSSLVTRDIARLLQACPSLSAPPAYVSPPK